jgi:hypothetical protein
MLKALDAQDESALFEMMEEYIQMEYIIRESALPLS